MSQDVSMNVIWAAEGIAKAIGRTPRQVTHMLGLGALPGARKIGGRWCITREALQALFGSPSKIAA